VGVWAAGEAGQERANNRRTRRQGGRAGYAEHGGAQSGLTVPEAACSVLNCSPAETDVDGLLRSRIAELVAKHVVAAAVTQILVDHGATDLDASGFNPSRLAATAPVVLRLFHGRRMPLRLSPANSLNHDFLLHRGAVSDLRRRRLACQTGFPGIVDRA
jgi:hypothetical protein